MSPHLPVTSILSPSTGGPKDRQTHPVPSQELSVKVRKGKADRCGTNHTTRTSRPVPPVCLVLGVTGCPFPAGLGARCSEPRSARSVGRASQLAPHWQAAHSPWSRGSSAHSCSLNSAAAGCQGPARSQTPDEAISPPSGLSH